ncbi:MAG: ribonucleoside-diphosphate reductase subunit alpha [Desulfovibrionaceae bacterium]|nr:ribonucleoside-diphosphate reductase subunit alpha [Desulfovibrionaceae bacterium]
MKKTVINREGIREKLDISKIREKLNKACLGLDVQAIRLESVIDSVYVEDIATSKIQASLINTAVSMTSVEESDWTFVAGRLLMMEVEREVYHARGFSYGDFVRTVQEGVNRGIYSQELLRYSVSELETISGYIDRERDWVYDYAGANMFSGRYLFHNEKGKIEELPQEAFLLIAMLLAVNESNDRLSWVKKFYDMLSLRKISLATPILANLRFPKSNLASCFIAAVDDSIEAIFKTVTYVAKISQNGGGVGLNLSRIRSKGAMVRNTKNVSGGIIPWVRIVNDTAVAVNQQGRRAGAVTVALDIWHRDIEQFLELQTENGDLRGKAYDVYPQIVIPDLFMRRVQESGLWTLFDPYEVRMKYNIELCELYGERFEELYHVLEEDSTLQHKKIVNAKELLKSVMRVQIETGMPYIFFKDTANLRNHNDHAGMVGSGNLCMESFSNFSPERTVMTEDGDSVLEEGIVHTCNLVSLNLAELLTLSDIAEASAIAVRILDNTIDLTTTPIPDSNAHNMLYRTIGVGATGLADHLAYHNILYPKAENIVGDIFETIALYTLKESALLARERGAYPLYKGSKWDNGILYGRTHNTGSPFEAEWIEVRQLIAKYGIRNAELTAIAPNTSTSLLMGCSASVVPIFSKFFIEKNQKGAVPRPARYIKECFWYYTELKHISPKEYIDIMSHIGGWVSQGVSMELLFDLNKGIGAKHIFETIMHAWEKKCKTIYYIRSIQKTITAEDCSSCSG